MPHDKDGKTGSLVRETLMTKHPDGKELGVKNIPEHKEYVELIEIKILEEITEQVSRNLSGGTVPTGLYSFSLRHYLLNCGRDRMVLRKTVANMVE